MRHPCLLLLLSGMLAAACSREEPAAPAAAPDARAVDPAKAASLAGRVLLEGPVPPNPRLRLSGDPVCSRAHPDGATADTWASENGGLGQVFVHVKDGLAGYRFEPPAEAVRVEQRGCQYRPHVFGVQVGQNIEFVNGDGTLHNVHALPDVNAEFNFSQVTQDQRDTRFFSRPEVMVRFKCDIHAWMSAFAGVVEHPYFAVTPASGSFELKNLPAGTFTVEAWHERLGRLTQQVTLTDNDRRSITFTFKAPAVPAP